MVRAVSLQEHAASSTFCASSEPTSIRATGVEAVKACFVCKASFDAAALLPRPSPSCHQLGRGLREGSGSVARGKPRRRAAKAACCCHARVRARAACREVRSDGHLRAWGPSTQASSTARGASLERDAPCPTLLSLYYLLRMHTRHASHMEINATGKTINSRKFAPRCLLRDFEATPDRLDTGNLDIVENIGWSFILREISQVKSPASCYNCQYRVVHCLLPFCIMLLSRAAPSLHLLPYAAPPPFQARLCCQRDWRCLFAGRQHTIPGHGA